MSVRSTISEVRVALASATAPRQPVGSFPCQGVYYRPAAKVPRVAMIAAHYSADMTGHFLGQPMAERGYGFLGWNSRFRSEEMFSLEHALVDVGAGVQWLLDQGVETVVLLGNSGGGSLMAAYQAQAAASTLSSPHEATQAALGELRPGALYISLNAHAGRPEYLTSILDPSVTDESDPTSCDPALDMFAAGNGPPYSAQFVTLYRAGQEARNRRITAWTLAERERLAGKGIADRIFSVPRVWADLRFLDGTLDPSDRPVGMCYAGDPRIANRGVVGMARATTLSTWLSLFSLDHSVCRAAPHLAEVVVPSLVVQTTHDAGVFPSDAQAIHDLLGAEDKTLVFRPGAHFLDTPATARDDVADLIVAWLSDRGARP